jgi:hypothetical protein
LRVARIARLNLRAEARVREQCARHARRLVVIDPSTRVAGEEQSWTFA